LLELKAGVWMKGAPSIKTLQSMVEQKIGREEYIVPSL